MFSVDNHRILITGASDGLGAHFAWRLAASGARVALGARRLERLENLAAEINEAGGTAIAVELDVTSRESVTKCLTSVKSEFGGIDTLVNNAGTTISKTFLDYTSDDWDMIINTNLKGAWTVAQECARQMIEQGRGGNIINVTSILASKVAGTVGPYCAASQAMTGSEIIVDNGHACSGL